MAMVTTFRFFDEDVAWGTRGFVESAERLLKKLQRDRSNEPDIPWVALCHELGGCLLQQALVLAVRDKTYQNLSIRLALIVFYDKPDFRDETLKPENYILHLLPKSDPGSYSPVTIMKELPHSLVSVSWEYAGISTYFGVQNTTTPWSAVPGDDSVEAVLDAVKRAVMHQRSPISQSLLKFLRNLPVDNCNQQLRLHKPIIRSKWWNTESSAYQRWKSQAESAPNILHVYNIPNSGSATIASQLFFETQGMFENAILITYAIQKQDLGTRPVKSFFLSLIRQILQNRPSLFYRIVALAEGFPALWTHNYVVLQNILLALFRATRNKPVVLILDEGENSNTSLVESLYGFVMDNREATTGVFKIIILTQGNNTSSLCFTDDVCCRIDTSNEEISRKLHTEFVSSKIRSLMMSRPQWKHCFEAAVERLATPRSFVQAGLMASYLETWSIHSTENAMKEALRVFPSTADEVFMMTLNRCKEESSFCIKSVVQWIHHAVCPLTVAELSVVVALSTSEKPSFDTLKRGLPLSLAHDLEDLRKTLVEFNGTHILPIYGNIGSDLVDDQGSNSHSMILSRCIEYLQSFFDHRDVESDGSEDEIGPEAELLGYTVREWPRHYNLSPSSSTISDWVLGFLDTREYVQAWFQLFQEYTGFPVEKYYELDNGLKVACWFGLVDVAQKAIERKKDGYSDTELSQALDLAAGNGQANVVKLLLETGASYNFGLCWASEGGFNDIVATLLDVNREDIDQTDKQGRTPLLLAVASGEEEIIAHLLDRGANPRLTVGPGINALHIAAMSGQVAIVQRLIDAKVDVRALTDAGENALKLAAGGGFDKIVKLLLPYEEDIDKMSSSGITALHFAAGMGHTSICDLLVGAGASIQRTTNGGLSLLHIAAAQGFVDMVQWLFSKRFTLVMAESSTHQVSGEGKNTDEQDNNTRKENYNEEEDKRDDPISHTFDETAAVLSPLQLAVQTGNIEVVRELLKHAEYNTEQERSSSLLLASMHGHIEIVDEVLRFGMVTAVKNKGGDTALHLAAREHHPLIVSRLLKLLVDGKAIFDVNAKDKLGWTPLHLAVASGRYTTIATLLENGAKMDEIGYQGKTVFHMAALSGDISNLETLWNRQRGKLAEKQTFWCAQEENGYTPFTFAAFKGHVGIMVAMLQKVSSSSNKIAKLQGDKKKALPAAAEGGQLDAVELLLSSGWDVNERDGDGNGALHFAAQGGNTPIIELLIANGAELKLRGDSGRTPLHLAAAFNSDGVKALLDNEATDIDALDDFGRTPLWHASYSAQVNCVKHLLQRLPNLNVIDAQNCTALHAAYKSPEITKLLLDAGADPKACDAIGLPLLPFVSSEPNAMESVQYYIQARLDPNIRNGDGYTAVHVAAYNNNLDIIKVLKDGGAHIAATGKQSETALHLAASQGHQDVVTYLLVCGLDVNQHSKSLGTPVIAATKGGKTEIVRSLIQKGADVNAISQDFNYHTAIQTAAAVNSTDTVQVLLDGHADVNLVGGECGSALCAAASVNNRDIAIRLLDAGADLDYAGGPLGTAIECALSRQSWDVATLCLERNAGLNLVSKGQHGTALVAAIHGDSLEMVQDLLNRGADPNLSSESGDVPTQAAIRKGRETILDLILGKGGKLSFRDKHGRGAISTAIVHNSIGLLRCLWGRDGIDVNERDAAQQTPLMLAMLQGVDVIGELVKNGAEVDLQDRWGKTALIYSIIRDYQPLASELIESGASQFITDARGRDALYWACRQSSTYMFSKIYQQIRKLTTDSDLFQRAISAAVASGQFSMVETLLDDIKFSQEQVDDDGWTARHSALRYNRPDLDNLIKAAILESGEKVIHLSPPVKLPTEWHELDSSIGLYRGTDTRVLKISKTFEPHINNLPRGVARANHPMWPQQHYVYYFEITILNQGDDGNRRFGVGFCDETASLCVQLGWVNGSWGYHGDDGKSFCGDNRATGDLFGPTYGQGDVVGCGVNFSKRIAFFTKNGDIVGRAFTNIQGKIYPAVSVDARTTNYEISARFWEDGEIGNKDFRFKGPFNNPRTFQESKEAATSSQHDEDSESETDSESTGTEESWGSG